jgi:hypothetical protein
MFALFLSLNVVALFLFAVWSGMFIAERTRARSLPPGMLSLFHRERATRAFHHAIVSGALALATAVGMLAVNPEPWL